MVDCAICNKEMKRVTSSHLKTHNITTAEYLAQFPGSVLFSDELRHAYGKHARDNNPMHDPVSVEKVRNALTGKRKTEEHKQKLSTARTGVSWGTHTPEHKEYMKVVSKINMEERIANGWKQKPWTAERRAKQSTKMIGNTIGLGGSGNKGKKLDLSDNQRRNRSKKRVEFMSKNDTPKTHTSIELSFIEFCKNNDILYIHQHPIHTEKGSWLFDFLLPNLNLLVEVDGEYWHTSKRQINRDLIKNNVALASGHTILRLSDTNLDFSFIFGSKDAIISHTNGIMESRIQSVKKSSGKDLP